MKAAKSTTIIGGADGPTSVFLVGRRTADKNIFRRIRNGFRQWKYRRKRKKAERMIKPVAHSLSETVQYMKDTYNAREADASFPHYEERRLQLKCSLLQYHKPELLGPQPQFLPPEDFQDQEAVSLWLDKIEQWRTSYEQKAAELPEEVFSTDYHLYCIDRGDEGSLEIETDHIHQILAISWNGVKEKMSPIARDISLYYGVTMEDIETRSRRYQSLLTELTT